jgi:hypothetical protein
MTEITKPKRIKRVFSKASEVLHLWANQSQSDARQGGRSRCYFEGTSCYSYGSHYELGRLVKYKGHTVALINAKGYSNTTRLHISYAWHAVSHILRIKHDGSTWNVREVLVQTQEKLIDELMGYFNQLAFWNEFDPFAKYGMESFNEFNALCDKLGHKELRLEITEDFKQLVRAHIAKRVARQAELKSIRSTPEYQAKLEQARLKKNKNEITKWRLGGMPTNAVRTLRPMILRISGDKVQTSGGASVPLDEALTLLRRITAKLAKPGDKVGHFTLDKVNMDEYTDGIVTIGCHTISLAEAKAVLGSVSTLKLVG